MPHVIITSVNLPPTTTSTPQNGSRASSPFEKSSAPSPHVAKLSIVGSTATSDFKPRLFRLTVPVIPVFFSGTGDMFAALMVARLREACQTAGLLGKHHWQSPDHVLSTELPLALAAGKVLASMHALLKKTMDVRQGEFARLEDETSRELNVGVGEEASQDKDKKRHLRLTKAAEVRVVRNWRDLVEPPNVQDFVPQNVEVDINLDTTIEPDELGVINTGTGGMPGAVHQV